MAKNLDELVGELTAFNHREAATAILKLRYYMDMMEQAAYERDELALEDIVTDYKHWVKNGI